MAARPLIGAPQRVAWQALRARAATLEARYGLPFRRYVGALRRMNRRAGGDLIIVPLSNGGK